jgi:hypothetical protein
VVEGGIRGWVGANVFWEMGQLDLSMGLESCHVSMVLNNTSAVYSYFSYDFKFKFTSAHVCIFTPWFSVRRTKV